MCVCRQQEEMQDKARRERLEREAKEKKEREAKEVRINFILFFLKLIINFYCVGCGKRSGHDRRTTSSIGRERSRHQTLQSKRIRSSHRSTSFLQI